MEQNYRHLWYVAIFRMTRSVAAGMISIAFPYLILTTLHRSPFVLGLLYMTAAVATAVFGLLFGFLADTWGKRNTLALVGLMLPVSSLLVYFSGHLAVLFVACVVGGYSATGSLMGGGVGGAAAPIQIVVLADLTTPERRTVIISLFTFLSGLFAALGALVERSFTVQQAFGAATWISGIGMLCLLPLQLSESRGDLRRLESKRVIGKFTLTGALNGFSQGLITPFLIPFFVIVYHLPRSQMSIYGFISGLLGAVALLAAPMLERRLGFVKSIAFTRGLGAALLLVMPLTRLVGLALLIYMLTPALRVMALPVQQTAMTGMVSEAEVGRALGINQVARLAASSGAISLTGYLFDASDIAAPFFIYGAIMAVNICLYFRFFHSPAVQENSA